MRKALFLMALVAVGSSPLCAQEPTLEERLGDLEKRTALFNSGKENLASGFAKFPQSIRQQACHAYPVESDLHAIASFKEKLAFLEAPDNAARLDLDQAARLATQKDTISKLVPGIDCSKLQ